MIRGTPNMKWNQLGNHFAKEHVKFNDLVLRDFKVLDRCTEQMFWDKAELKAAVSDLFYCKGFGDEIRRKNVAFHLRDDRWLVRYIDEIVNTVKVPYHARNEQDPLADKVHQLHVPMDSIKKYVKFADSFDARRNQFENDLVKAYVVDRLNAQGFMLGTDAIAENYDELFRDQVVASLGKIKMDQHRAETYLEQNANLWRKPVMKRAFLNQNLLLGNQERAIVAEHNPQLYQQLKNREKSDFQNWVRLREYDYYQKHQAIVDATGTATAAMKMDLHEKAYLTSKEGLLNELYRDTLQACHHYVDHNFQTEQIYAPKQYEHVATM